MNPSEESLAGAHREAYDVKLMRVKQPPVETWCHVCHGKQSGSPHSITCPLATINDASKEVDRARKAEQWARDRAADWLQAVRTMHGKLAMLKRENNELREKLKELKSPPW